MPREPERARSVQAEPPSLRPAEDDPRRNPQLLSAIAKVQLMPDPTITSHETGTRHRTAERVAKQTGALVISISRQRETVSLFVGQSRYQLDSVADVLAKTNQALGTLETYRQRLEQVLTRLTALEFQNAVVLDDVLVVLQRAQMALRMAE